MHFDQIPTGSRNETNLRNICGPDLSRLEKLKTVLSFIRDECQAELVCFVDGPDSRDNYAEHFENFNPDKKDKRYENDIRVIDGIQSQDYRIFWAPTDRILFQSIKTLAKRYGKLWHAQKNIRRHEIARYAIEHNAMAVLSKQSDYLLYIGR